MTLQPTYRRQPGLLDQRSGSTLHISRDNHRPNLMPCQARHGHQVRPDFRSTSLDWLPASCPLAVACRDPVCMLCLANCIILSAQWALLCASCCVHAVPCSLYHSVCMLCLAPCIGCNDTPRVYRHRAVAAASRLHRSAGCGPADQRGRGAGYIRASPEGRANSGGA